MKKIKLIACLSLAFLGLFSIAGVVLANSNNDAESACKLAQPVPPGEDDGDYDWLSLRPVSRDM